MAYSYPSNFTNTYWRVIDGDIYVSYLGSNISGTGSPTRPYKTIQHAVTQASTGAKVIVGTGEYNEAVNGLNKSCKIIGDGTVLSKGSAASIAFSNMGSNSVIQNFFITEHKVAVDGTVKELANCVIQSLLTSFSGSIRYTVLTNLSITGVSPVRLINCTMLGVTSTSATAFTRLENCQIGNTCNLQLNTSALLYFDYCNQQTGSVIQINGVPLNTPALVTASHSGFQVHGLSVNPQFNQPEIGDYTLAKTSLLRFSGTRKLPVGAFNEGVKVSVKQMLGGNLSGISLTNIILNENNFFELTKNVSQGTIETPVVDLGSIRPVRTLRLYADQIFDDAAFRYVSTLSNGNLPGALTVEMKYSDSEDTLADALYQPMIWDKVPSFDSTLRGNGELSFTATDMNFITTRYVQFRITLRNGQEIILLSQEDYNLILQEDERQIRVE